MKINSIFSRLCLAVAIAATGAVQVNAQTIQVFGNGVNDLSAFDDTDGSATALVSVVGSQLSVLDDDPNDAPEAYVNFGNTVGSVLNGVRLEFDFEFDTDDLTVQNTNPEVLVRFGNVGVQTDSNGDTGFQLNLRHADDSTNQIRAANGTSSTSSGLGDFTTIADGQSINVIALINNDSIAQDYVAFGGGSGTVASGTYDLFIDGTFIQNYEIVTAATSGFDPALGFGAFGLNSSGSADAGVEVLFDNITIGLNADNGFIAVPEPSSAVLLLSGLFSLGLMRRRS